QPPAGIAGPRTPGPASARAASRIAAPSLPVAALPAASLPAALLPAPAATSGSTASGAPLPTASTRPSGVAWYVIIRRVAASNGCSPIRGAAARSVPASPPHPAAKAARAAPTGAPTAGPPRPAVGGGARRALLH